MSYQSDIFIAIRSSAALTALIGDRFAWDIMDGTIATPYLVAQTISGGGETTHEGDREWSFPTIQFSAWSPSKAQAIEVIATLRREIEGVELPGQSSVSLGYAGEQSNYDSETKFYGEILELRASTLTN